MMQWNRNSNACDVLGLGPRTAGNLATVGIRSVAELLAASPRAVGRRLRGNTISAELLADWQCEARLIMALPELPADAARLLAVAGIGNAEQLERTTPTQLLAALETAQQKHGDSWIAQAALPTIAEVSDWIRCARGDAVEPEEFFRAA